MYKQPNNSFHERNYQCYDFSTDKSNVHWKTETGMLAKLQQVKWNKRLYLYEQV